MSADRTWLQEPLPPVLTIPQAAQLLQVSTTTLYREIARGKIKVVTGVGTRKLIARATILQLIGGML